MCAPRGSIRPRPSARSRSSWSSGQCESASRGLILLYARLGGVGSAAVITADQLNRLRWRCRRGMLENDLILTRFLDLRGQAITEPELVGLDRLLGLGDNELWDLLSGRQGPDEAAVAPLLETLRAVKNGGCGIVYGVVA